MIRPMLGVVPRFVWEERRFSDLQESINRFVCAGNRIPPEWVEEYNELLKRILKQRGTIGVEGDAARQHP
ncbi:hypothetical protein GXP70_12400 [Paenibacillus lycopersici]|uniref:Uncharacterized protein n=1 Tax=Paenibacillus lycopersici TaxID=2704462 RepID=A0A6C0FYW3_9BACL|nr:hypothetical protein [Paenibacillus lycopersici]QHT60661.1 hypothetical protein GXP70_12400 [Paenibacillus lycopersici]